MHAAFRDGEDAGPNFLARDFFYVNCRVIYSSQCLEIWFKANEKEAIRKAAQASDACLNNIWYHLGFNADALIYGPVGTGIEHQYGADIYQSVMIKSLICCVPAFTEKVIKQLAVYYFGLNRCFRIPGRNPVLNDHSRVAESIGYLGGVSNAQPLLKKKYADILDASLNTSSAITPADAFWNYRLWLLEMLLSSILFVYAAVLSIVRLIKGKIDIMLMMLVAHLLVLITIAVAHTIDIDRYSYAVFPLFSIVLLLALQDIFYKLTTSFSFAVK
jgi:hypothetical protein